MNVGELVAYLKVDDKEFNSKLDQGQSKFGAFAKVAGAAAAAGAVAVGAFAVASVKEFTTFEKGMNEVFTLMPGMSQKAMRSMQDDVLAFSSEMGVTSTQVVPALYQAISAGVPRENVFTFLEVAQKAAVGGVTDLSTAVDGISSVVNSYGEEVIDAAKASDLMFTAVKLGKTDFSQLSSTLYNVLPTASALGVQFEDVTAAIAVMTAQGIPTAQATTMMRQAFVELSKDGGKTSDLFKEIAGKSFKDFIAAGGNTQEALQLLEKHAEKTGVGINDLFGSVEAGGAALALTGGSTGMFTDALAEMRDSAGATDTAYQQMDQGLSRAWERIGVALEKAKIQFGRELAPTVERLADLAGQHLPAMLAFAGAALGALVGVLITVGTAASDAGAVISSVAGFISDNSTVFTVVAGIIAAVFIPHLVAMATAATVNAAKVVVAWVATSAGAIAAAAVHSAQVVLMIARWVAHSVAATVNAAKIVAGWVLTSAAAVAAGAVMVAQVAIQVGRWVFLGVQSTLAAAKVAAAWLISMGPIALVIAAVVGLVAVIVKNWDTIKSVISAGWDAVKRATAAVWDWIKGAVSAAVGFVTNVFLNFTGPGLIIKHWDTIKRTFASGVESVVSFMRSLPGKILAAVGNLGSLLSGAGRAVIDGFLDGITGAFRKVKETLGKLTSMLPDWKGPATRDALILRDAGRLVMGGFESGLIDKFGDVKRTLGSITSDIGDVAGMRVGGPDFVQQRLGVPAAPAVNVAAPDLSELVAEVRALRAEVHDLPRSYRLAERTR